MEKEKLGLTAARMIAGSVNPTPTPAVQNASAKASTAQAPGSAQTRDAPASAQPPGRSSAPATSAR